jgi:putative DNA primase/helicase
LFQLKAMQPIQIVQRKSKDAEEAAPVFASLKLVQIKGWFDEDGEPVSSAVLVAEDAPPERKKESKLDGHKKLFISAWWASGAEVVDDLPYISRSALMDYIVSKSKPKISEASARQYCKPSVQDKLIGSLTIAEIIEPKEHGWAVTCPSMRGVMMIRKNGSK